VETLDISEMREKLRNGEAREHELQTRNKTLQQEVKRLKVQLEAFRSKNKETRNMEQEGDSLKKQLEELDNAVEPNLEARFYKC